MGRTTRNFEVMVKEHLRALTSNNGSEFMDYYLLEYDHILYFISKQAREYYTQVVRRVKMK